MRRKNWQMTILFRLIKNMMDRGDLQSKQQCQAVRDPSVVINARHRTLLRRF